METIATSVYLVENAGAKKPPIAKVRLLLNKHRSFVGYEKDGGCLRKLISGLM